MTVSTLMRLGAGFLLFIFLARKLGPEIFGQLAYWLAFSSLLALLVNYGFGLQLLREIGRDPNSAAKVYRATLAAKIVLSLLIIVVGLVIGLLESVPTTIFWSLLIMALAESFAEHINFVLRALGYFDKEARFSLFTSALNFFGVLLPLLVFGTITAVAVGFLLSRCATLLLGWRLALPFLPVMQKSNDWSFADVWKTLRDGFPYAADMAVSTLNSTLDVILLSYMTSTKAVGLYQAGLKLMQGANSIAPIVGNVYTPHIASQQMQRADCSSIVTKLILKMSLLGGGVGAIFAVGNILITNLLFGVEYSQLSILLPWFGLALIVRFVAAGFGINLTAHGLQTVRVFANGLALVVLIVVAMIAIPIYGVVGMLMAFVCATLLVGALYLGALYRQGIPTGINVLNVCVIFIFLAPIAIQILGNTK